MTIHTYMVGHISTVLCVLPIERLLSIEPIDKAWVLRQALVVVGTYLRWKIQFLQS